MKVAINRCYGGFSLSPKAIARIAELEGRDCYFFLEKDDGEVKDKYRPANINDCKETFFWTAFDIPNPNEVLSRVYGQEWKKMTNVEKQAFNDTYRKHVLNHRYDSKDRANPNMIQAIEELGDEANGSCAKLKIVEIPDEVNWTIDEYDGMERIAEKRQVWS